MSSQTIDLCPTKDATTNTASSSISATTPTNSSITKPSMAPSKTSDETSPLLSGKASSQSDKKPTNFLLTEKSRYKPPSETHPAFATLEDASSVKPPAYAAHEEDFDTGKSQAGEDGPMWKKAIRSDGGKKGSGGYSVGVGGAGNYRRKE